MEQGWSAADDAVLLRPLRNVVRLWQQRFAGRGPSSSPSAVDVRSDGVDVVDVPARGRVRRRADPDPFACVRVGIDPREIHLD